MGTYTVKSGDTLSGIGARNGVNWRTITGYRSGNPNLIYPGEVLTWGGGAPTPAPAPSAPAPASAQPAINWDQILAKQKTDREALISGQKKEAEGLYGQFEQKRAGQAKLQDVYGGFAESTGYNNLQGLVNYLNTQLGGLQTDIQGLGANIADRTAGSVMSQGQRDRLKQVEEGALRSQVSNLGNILTPTVESLKLAGNDVQALTQLTAQQQENELEPMRMRISALSDRFAREFTGFTQERESELNVLFDKLARDRALADREWEKVEQLAREEREFSRQKQLMDKDFQNQLALKRAGGGSGGGGVGGGTESALASALSRALGTGGTYTGGSGTQNRGLSTSVWNNLSGISLQPSGNNNSTSLLFGGGVNPQGSSPSIQGSGGNPFSLGNYSGTLRVR